MYRSHNIVREIKSRTLRWAGHVARMEEGRSVYKILTGKPTGRRPLRRPRRRWEDNIRVIKWAGQVARMEEGRICFKILKPIGKRPLGRPKCGGEEININYQLILR